MQPKSAGCRRRAFMFYTNCFSGDKLSPLSLIMTFLAMKVPTGHQPRCVPFWLPHLQQAVIHQAISGPDIHPHKSRQSGGH